METHLPRSEIVRLVRSLLGIQTTSGLAAQVSEQHVTAVQFAAAEVATDCRWVNAQRRVTVALNAQQDTMNYPPGTGPGMLIGMSVWVTDRYVSLIQAVLPTNLDTDHEMVTGGATLTSVCSVPRYFEQKDQIKLYPRTDIAYDLRVEYMADMTLPTVSSVSVVDAMLIVYKAAEMISQQMENPSAASIYAARYESRLGDLRAWQAAGGAVVLSTEADLGESEGNFLGSKPNWSTAPTIPPS